VVPARHEGSRNLHETWEVGVRHQYDGFWFPANVRDAIITPERSYSQLHFRDGGPTEDGDVADVTIRWPQLDLSDWERVIRLLKGNQQRAGGQPWHERLPRAVHRMRDIWADRENPLRQGVLEALVCCTGHSVGMLDVALSLLDLISVDDLQRAASCRFPQAVKGEFVAVDGLAGRFRFFPERWWTSLTTQALLPLASYRKRPWRLRRRSTDLILGYAAGNVPGTGLLLILLGLAAAASEGIPPPLILVKNSRREPLFTPLVLTALELVDPALVSTTLVTLWDYTDATLQEALISQADLVVAAASDETIEDIGQVVQGVSTSSRPIRFHPHGHKVSFSTLGRECLEKGHKDPESGAPLVDVVALLAALDAALWNQQGCLSSRVHFVEQGTGQAYHSPAEYGEAVVQSLRALDRFIPKGISKKRQIHNLFDKYQAIASSRANSGELGQAVQVLSSYDDDFMVLLEQRALTAEQFREIVNDCQGRTVAIIPVKDVMEVSQRSLRQVHPEHLQSMSVAVGRMDQPGLDPRLVRYAEALGRVGVTGIRTVGRGAFPQLAYSWDGLIPLDLTVERPKGHFTALEFGDPWTQIYETYHLVRQTMNAGKMV
jgi:hypothetical protein